MNDKLVVRVKILRRDFYGKFLGFQVYVSKRH